MRMPDLVFGITKVVVYNPIKLVANGSISWLLLIVVGPYVFIHILMLSEKAANAKRNYEKTIILYILFSLNCTFQLDYLFNLL